jgi:hypothetical protein
VPASGAGAPKRWRRRSLGLALCLAPVGLALICILRPAAVPPERVAFGLTLAVAAALLGAFNLYLALVRPWVHRRRRGSDAGLRRVSGLPVLGTLFVVGGCLAAFGHAAVGWLALLAAAIDPDGLPWLPIWTWHDRSLWDGPSAGAGVPPAG